MLWYLGWDQSTHVWWKLAIFVPVRWVLTRACQKEMPSNHILVRTRVRVLKSCLVCWKIEERGGGLVVNTSFTSLLFFLFCQTYLKCQNLEWIMKNSYSRCRRILRCPRRKYFRLCSFATCHIFFCQRYKNQKRTNPHNFFQTTQLNRID